jgi:predicted CXXCH cytochrome family protein
MRLGRILPAALALAAPLAAIATDAPHDASFSGVGGAISCQSCHVAHHAADGTLTKTAGNFNLCQSCHLNQTSFGFPWSTAHQAAPGTGGRSHRWDAPATNLGASAPNPSSSDPVESAMGKRLDAGKLQCSTCHDQHQADVYTTDATVHSSVALATAIARTAGTGSGGLQLTTVPAGAKAAGYVIKISAATAFKISHDNGLTWFGYNGTLTPKWAADSNASYASGKAFTAGTPVTLDDELTAVTFTTGTFVTTDVFSGFYVSYPYLRGDDTAGRMCTTCHRDRNQTWQNVEGTGPLAGNGQTITLGQTVFSHPVGQALSANGRGYDRATILDADGSLQTTGDGIKSNDLVLAGSGAVSCLSCHHPHNADSNSLSVDPR